MCSEEDVRSAGGKVGLMRRGALRDRTVLATPGDARVTCLLKLHLLSTRSACTRMWFPAAILLCSDF